MRFSNYLFDIVFIQALYYFSIINLYIFYSSTFEVSFMLKKIITHNINPWDTAGDTPSKSKVIDFSSKIANLIFFL